MIFDPLYLILMAPFIVLGLIAQAWIRGAYRKWSMVANSRGMTGAQVAAAMLQSEGLMDITPARGGHGPLGSVRIEVAHGVLSDHYDPRERVIRLSENVYAGRSIAAAAIAAHETGHAIQHARRYAPLTIRSLAVPAAVTADKLVWILVLLGLLVSRGGGGGGGIFFMIALALYAAAVFLAVVSLPVEFNASGRALRALTDNGLLLGPEIGGARAVLGAAASTYVVAALMSIANMLYILLLAQRR